MNTRGSRRKGNIYTAIDQDFRVMWVGQLAGRFDEFEQCSRAPIFFANLNPRDTRFQISGDRVQQRFSS